jgi:hypothetical protein
MYSMWTAPSDRDYYDPIGYDEQLEDEREPLCSCGARSDQDARSAARPIFPPKSRRKWRRSRTSRESRRGARRPQRGPTGRLQLHECRQSHRRTAGGAHRHRLLHSSLEPVANQGSARPPCTAATTEPPRPEVYGPGGTPPSLRTHEGSLGEGEGATHRMRPPLPVAGLHAFCGIALSAPKLLVEH